MSERNIEFGKYGARGIKGHEAVARQPTPSLPSPPGAACTTSPAPTTPAKLPGQSA